MTGCPNATQRTRHASVTGRRAPTLPVYRSSLQRVTSQQQRSNLVVGDLWPFLEEVADGIEGLGGGRADEFVDLGSQPFRRVRRGDRRGQHYPTAATLAHGLDAGLRGVPGGDSVVGQNHRPSAERRQLSRSQARQPGSEFLALPGGGPS